MKLERSTYVKIALIVLLCLGVCGFFGGCGRGVVVAPLGSLLAPGGLMGCVGWNAMGEIAGYAGDAVGEMAGYAGDAASEVGGCDAAQRCARRRLLSASFLRRPRVSTASTGPTPFCARKWNSMSPRVPSQ